MTDSVPPEFLQNLSLLIWQDWQVTKPNLGLCSAAACLHLPLNSESR